MRLLLNIDVDDIDRAIDFYRDAFGLDLGRRLFDGSVAEMVGASSTIYLLTKPAGTMPFSEMASGRDYRRHWTPVHIDFEVADIVEPWNARWKPERSSKTRLVHIVGADSRC